ncbi:hypothetical protein CCH79_00016678 [Gambusia affinis]|uniref:Uncharacterized protein n=1 Tax=Gambusia affinis TaxID=33528 RepID=A0A315W9S9_GAMAF|nr:hypothetical protein CCH79_00016678 [Gambusia affinis]
MECVTTRGQCCFSWCPAAEWRHQQINLRFQTLEPQRSADRQDDVGRSQAVCFQSEQLVLWNQRTEPLCSDSMKKTGCPTALTSAATQHLQLDIIKESMRPDAAVFPGPTGLSDVRSSAYFRLLLVSVVWKTLEADMRFSMYWPRTWFSDFNFRFSSFTASTRADSECKETFSPSKVCWSSSTWLMSLVFSSSSAWFSRQKKLALAKIRIDMADFLKINNRPENCNRCALIQNPAAAETVLVQESTRYSNHSQNGQGEKCSQGQAADLLRTKSSFKLWRTGDYRREDLVSHSRQSNSAGQLTSTECLIGGMCYHAPRQPTGDSAGLGLRAVISRLPPAAAWTATMKAWRRWWKVCTAATLAVQGENVMKEGFDPAFPAKRVRPEPPRGALTLGPLCSGERQGL